MKSKKMTAAVISVAAALSPFASGGISAFIPQTVFAEQQTAVSALPDWIPSDFESALEFRNTYGATHIRDGLICIVFKLQNYSAPEGEPQGVKRYDIRTTKDMMKELEHSIYGSSGSEYSYEVVVYHAPQETGKFEVALVDTWLQSPELDLGYNHAAGRYSFMVDKDSNEITETDIYGWLPDCITEYNDYKEKNGKVSAHDEFVVFCLDSGAGTPYQWFEDNRDYTSNFDNLYIVDCSRLNAVPLDGGALKNIEVYKAKKDGKSKIVWNYAPTYDYSEVEIQKTLIADCTVHDGASRVTIDDSYVQEAEFSYSQYSLYSGELTVSADSIYNKFDKQQSAVITSKNELVSFLSAYLNDSALNKFASQYSDVFFENNVLMLNTYLDPYRGRIFKHGLKGAYYKDGKLNVDYTSVITAQLMRTSYFDILQLVVPKKDYDASCEAVWQGEEILNYDLKRISFIDEDTGELLKLTWENVEKMFGDGIKSIEGGNPFYWDTEFYTGDWHELTPDEKGLPEDYELSETAPKEIKEYAYNSADIIFKVKKTKPVDVKCSLDRFSATTRGLFSDKMEGSGYKEYKPTVITSKEELDEILSLYITEEYRKKYYSKYDDVFFGNNVLLLNFFIDSSGGDKVKINDGSVTSDTISVYYTMPGYDFGVCNTDYFCILQAVVPKSAYSGQKAEWKCIGDINADGSFGVADLVSLQKWLHAGTDAKLADPKAADLCKDDNIDVFDLIELRKLLISVNKLDEPMRYGVEAQCIRTDGYISGAKYPMTKLITSTEELEKYIQDNKDTYHLTSDNFTEAVSKYDDLWFRYYKLMVVVLEEGSGSVSHEVTEVTDRSVTIERRIPEVGTADMAEWHILIQYPTDAQISDNFKVNLTKKQIK